MQITPVDFSLPRRRTEVEAKLARVRALLAQHDLEGLVLTKHPNFSWITAGGKNFVASCFDGGATAIVVTRDRAYALCSVIEAPRMAEEEQLEQLGFELLVHGWERDETAVRVAQIVDPDKTGADVAANGWREVGALLSPLRAALTADERDRYRYLGEAMSYALEHCLLQLAPGLTEWEIAGRLSDAVWAHEVEPVMLLVTADERGYRYRHGLPTGKRMERGVIVSVNGRYKGLIATVSRMIYFGAVPAEVSARYDACLEIECAAIAQLRPGAPEREVYCTLRRAYERCGYGEMFDRHGQGGCQGYYPREYMFTADNPRAVRVNHSYSFNPVIDGAKTEDPVLVCEDGIRLITKPVLFPVRDMQAEGLQLPRPGLPVL